MPKMRVRKVMDTKQFRMDVLEMLRELPCMENALANHQGSSDNREIFRLRRRVTAIYRGLGMLSEEERKVILQIADGKNADDICHACSMEKSTMYRIRKRALDRFSLALFGRV